MSERIAQHYRSLLVQHGDSAESAQYSSRESQERRFAQLAKIGKLEGSSVLDFGCGTAHLASWLESKQIDVRYTGVDVVDEFFPIAAAKHPNHRFGRLEQFAHERFDYVLVSGVFNNKRRGNRKFYQDCVKQLFALCDRGLGFNMMSTYVDYKDPDLFYERPEQAFAFVKREVTPFVTLHHAYAVKTGVIPFEFAVFAYRNEVE